MRNLSYEHVFRIRPQVNAFKLFILPVSEAVIRTTFELYYISKTRTFYFSFLSS
jgi:hypothetical protein